MSWNLRKEPLPGATAVNRIASIRPIKPVAPIKLLRPVNPIAPIGFEYYWRDDK